MNAERFRDLLVELIDENPFAIRPALQILEVCFTEAVPTLAVTCEERPQLLVNLEFVAAHCRTDAEVKAVICHEFLHVLLRHTEEKTPVTPARHLAADAVINAIIHRQFGVQASSMMSAYYADAKDLVKLLRPMSTAEGEWYASHADDAGALPQWAHAWHSLYAGSLVADDIKALASDLGKAGSDTNAGATDPGPFALEGGLPNGLGDLLGNHDDVDGPLPSILVDALNRAMRAMNGSGIWREPKGRGVGANPYDALFSAQDELMRRWQRRTLEILRRHLTPDRRSRATHRVVLAYRIPVLSPGDRRAFVKSLWLPFIPDSAWQTEAPRREGTAQIYLDVSGSMYAEMPQIIALLARLKRHIRRPFWAFSTEVVPALIEHGQLKTITSGGTSMTCVLEHIAKTQPGSAVVVTDGYIEKLDRKAVMAEGTRLHVLVTRDGSPAELRRAGLAYTQLDEVPA